MNNGIPVKRICLILTFLLTAGCAGGQSRPEPMISETFQRGEASWYGPSFHGNRTANGEPYDMWALTAAHRTLPFGTRVLVHSLDTGKSVTVRINDRGPFIRGRIIDLSYGAARELAMIGRGTANVSLTILKATNASAGYTGGGPESYWVQVGSFTTLTQAVALHKQLAYHYPNIRLTTVDLPSGQWHRVQIGTFPSQEKAKIVAIELEKQFDLDSLLIQGN
ncbi:septal ring lytic transglycosylase RlpA family protein [Candidatus Nitrospira allomarina]|uniref:Probable endolytic peptidoglycan transglycosylase RlpA n=1 Tax=Candidatus Nitrospira allomarina TaxID=3020900 RepID=A0AA96JR48_9BACT|nr:septal ring lytic transglycosylase RlpA family protein [Candidatus Nitrospira allomarina]WNM57162.1 septal ring lytic transglycosylase RlpA family protein [Candidatus Nitrospira allomarina]